MSLFGRLKKTLQQFFELFFKFQLFAERSQPKQVVIRVEGHKAHERKIAALYPSVTWKLSKIIVLSFPSSTTGITSLQRWGGYWPVFLQEQQRTHSVAA